MRNLVLFLIAGAALVCGQPAAAPATKQKPPAPGPARAFSFPKYDTKKLANGLTVFVVEDHREPVVSYWLAVNAGFVMNEPKKAGLAGFTAAMLRNGGTKTRTSQDIAKLVDSNGGSLNANAAEDAAQVHGTWMKSNANMGLDLLSDVVLNPVFDAKELDRLRQQELSGLQIAFSDPESLLSMAAPRVVYGDNPYAYPGSGTPETIRALTRDDLVNFHRTYFVPGGAYLAITGDIQASDAFAQADKFFGKWSGAAVAPPKLSQSPEAQRRVLILDKPDAPQTRIFVGEIGVARNSPDYIPLLLADEAYGGAFTSRLNMRLRANEGLTYGARSTLQTFRAGGAFATETFTRTEKTSDALKAILDVQQDLTTNPVTAVELDDAKARLVGGFQLSTETPDAVAERLIMAAVNGLPADYYSHYAERLRSTTLDQLNATAKKYFHADKTAIVVVGNASQFGKQLAAFGPVKTIKAADFDPTAPDLTRPKEATPEATAETKARGRQMIDAAVKALGGAQAVRSVNDISSKSTVTLKTPQGEMKAESSEDIMFPDKYRAVLKLPFGEMTQVFDGKSFWLKQGPAVRDMPANLLPEALRNVRAAGAIGLLRDALDGKAEVQSIENEGVLWKEGDSTIKLYFDPQTHLVSKMVFKSMGMTGSVDVEQTLADYRATGPVKLPFKESLTQGGQPGGERIFTERKVNSGLKTEMFVKPQ